MIFCRTIEKKHKAEMNAKFKSRQFYEETFPFFEPYQAYLASKFPIIDGIKIERKTLRRFIRGRKTQNFMLSSCPLKKLQKVFLKL